MSVHSPRGPAGFVPPTLRRPNPRTLTRLRESQREMRRERGREREGGHLFGLKHTVGPSTNFAPLLQTDLTILQFAKLIRFLKTPHSIAGHVGQHHIGSAPGMFFFLLLFLFFCFCVLAAPTLVEC